MSSLPLALLVTVIYVTAQAIASTGNATTFHTKHFIHIFLHTNKYKHSRNSILWMFVSVNVTSCASHLANKADSGTDSGTNPSFRSLTGRNKCVARNFGFDSVVCECNATLCDDIGSAVLPSLGKFSSYLSSMSGSRLEPQLGRIQWNSSGTGESCG